MSILRPAKTFPDTQQGRASWGRSVSDSVNLIIARFTQYLPLTGGALTGDLIVPGEAYGAPWNGSDEVPTKNALWDKIETISAGVIADADYGDIVVSAGVWSFDTGVVTAFAKTFLDDANAAAVRTTLGLGTLATQSGTFSGTSSGTNTGDQTITLTGPITGTGTGSFATTITAKAVTLAKMDDVATATVFYRKTAGTGVPEVQTLATLKTDLGLTGTNSGDQTITLTGDVTGTGTGSFATTLANSGVSAASYTNASVTFDAKGRATAASSGTAPAMVLLEQHTASASATLDFTTAISSTYDTYVIEFVDLVPATNNVSLQMRMSTDGGATYDSTGLYDFAGHQTNTGTFDGAINSGSSTTSGTIVQGVANTTSNSVCGELKLYGPGGSLFKKVVGATTTLKNDANFYITSCGGRYRNITAVNAFRFLFSSGNIASGTIRVYGMTK